MTRKLSSPFINLILGAAFILGAYFMHTYLSVPMMEEAKASESWPSVQGIVSHSEIQQSTRDETIMYAAVIKYEFTVDSISYLGNRISLSSENSKTSSAREVKKVLQKYPLGERVKVFYDPELPENSVLETGADTLTYIIKYVPFVLALFGVLMLYQVIRVFAMLLLALFAGLRK